MRRVFARRSNLSIETLEISLRSPGGSLRKRISRDLAEDWPAVDRTRAHGRRDFRWLDKRQDRHSTRKLALVEHEERIVSEPVGGAESCFRDGFAFDGRRLQGRPRHVEDVPRGNVPGATDLGGRADHCPGVTDRLAPEVPEELATRRVDRVLVPVVTRHQRASRGRGKLSAVGLLPLLRAKRRSQPSAGPDVAPSTERRCACSSHPDARGL